MTTLTRAKAKPVSTYFRWNSNAKNSYVPSLFYKGFGTALFEVNLRQI